MKQPLTAILKYHCLLSISLICALTASGQTVFRVSNLENIGPGSLREAISNANLQPGADIINFDTDLSGTILLNGSLPVINDALTINGPANGNIKISGNGLYRILTVSNNSVNPEVTINGLEFINGLSNSAGGLVNGGKSRLYLNRCIFSGNISPNTGAGNGGAIGNAIYASLYINECSFINNFAFTFGGAIYNIGFLRIANSTFSGNSAFMGGAIMNILNSGKCEITNCTISGNATTGGSGAGIFSDLSSTIQINNSTITGNHTTGAGKGGGIFTALTTASMKSSIIAANSATYGGNDILGRISSLGNNLVGDSTGSGIVSGQNNDRTGSLSMPLDPMLGPLADNGGPTLTHELLTGSPAIDAGSCNGLDRDQRGVSRSASNPCDIGSFEAAPPLHFSAGELTVFIGAFSPADNGKKTDLMAELILDDSVLARSRINGKQVAGHIANAGIKCIFPLGVTGATAFPGQKLKVRILAKKSGKQEASLKLWFNTDSLAANSRGFSRVQFAMEQDPLTFKYLSRGFHLTDMAGTESESVSFTTDSSFRTVGTWTMAIQSPLPVTAPVRTAARMTALQEASCALYPNPAGNTIHIALRETQASAAMIQLLSTDGKLITEKNTRITSPSPILQLDVSGYNPGMYLVRVLMKQPGGKTKVFKSPVAIIR